MTQHRIVRGVESPSTARKKLYIKYGLTLGGMLLQEAANVADWIIVLYRNRQMGWEEYKERSERQRAYEERECLRLLARNKLLEVKRTGEKLMVRLTAKGWQQALRDKICCAQEFCKSREFIAVVFDVPESEKHVRHALRLVLAQCGFTMLQKSIWITRKEVLKELCALLQGSKLDRWVRILRSSEIRLGAIGKMTVQTKARMRGRG